jgi:GcrA cell cycle regulator
MTGAAWTDERVETLKLLWRDGMPASEIAGELGGITRNAVIGKVHRLGINKAHPRARPAQRPRTRALVRTGGRRVVVRTRVARVVVESPAPLTAPPPLRIALADLEPKHCRWPLGDPRASSFAFCGCDRPRRAARQADHDPRTFYCAFHTDLSTRA